MQPVCIQLRLKLTTYRTIVCFIHKNLTTFFPTNLPLIFNQFPLSFFLICIHHIQHPGTNFNQLKIFSKISLQQKLILKYSTFVNKLTLNKLFHVIVSILPSLLVPHFLMNNSSLNVKTCLLFTITFSIYKVMIKRTHHILLVVISLLPLDSFVRMLKNKCAQQKTPLKQNFSMESNKQ